jgi:hypothetical protein
MSAKDYQICPACFDAYIAKVSKKNPGQMTDDRRKIDENEILMLIDWYLDKKADEGEHGISFASHAREGMRIRLKFYKPDENTSIEK